MGWHLRTNCSECRRLFNYNGSGGLTCDACKALKVTESEMKEFIHTCERCKKQCHALELRKGLCQNCVANLTFTIDPGKQTKDNMIDVVHKQCSSCNFRWNFIRGEETPHCPNCGVSYTETVITRQEERNIANVDANTRKVMDEHIKQLEIFIAEQEKEISQSKIHLATLKLVRGMMK